MPGGDREFATLAGWCVAAHREGTITTRFLEEWDLDLQRLFTKNECGLGSDFHFVGLPGAARCTAQQVIINNRQ